jgi:uncharacterized caspase-like protein
MTNIFIKEYRMKKTTFLITILMVFAMIPLKVFGGELEIASPEGKKYALVIGNNNYSRSFKLAGAGKDAIVIADKLTKLDFDVTILTNVTAAQMSSAIDTFTAQLRSSSNNQGFFWFSGNGVQLDHISYLAGIDYGFSVESTRTGIVSLGKLFEALNGARNTMNLVVVDTCFSSIRNSETTVSLETALLQQLFGNICYIRSSAPGEVSMDNSPFIGPVLKYLNTPTEMASSFSTIAEETATASGNMQRPVFYITNKDIQSRGR